MTISEIIKLDEKSSFGLLQDGCDSCEDCWTCCDDCDDECNCVE